MADPSQIDVYHVAVDSQQAALDALRPGVMAEDVHKAYAKVIQVQVIPIPFDVAGRRGLVISNTRNW